MVRDTAYKGVVNYFNALTKYGYKNYQDTYKLLLLLFIDDLLTGPLSIYVTEEDYRIIDKALYCLYGSSCLIPYPEYTNGTSLIHVLNTDTLRLTEDCNLRFTEDEQFRLLNI